MAKLKDKDIRTLEREINRLIRFEDTMIKYIVIAFFLVLGIGGALMQPSANAETKKSKSISGATAREVMIDYVGETGLSVQLYGPIDYDGEVYVADFGGDGEKVFVSIGGVRYDVSNATCTPWEYSANQRCKWCTAGPGFYYEVCEPTGGSGGGGGGTPDPEPDDIVGNDTEPSQPEPSQVVQ